MPKTYVHPQLGKLEWNNKIKSWKTRLELLPGIGINLVFDVPDPTAIDPAGAFVLRAQKLDSRCRARITKDLLKTYNESWADDDPKVGSPRMKSDEFLASLRPSSITVCEDGTSEWMYECGDLFAGHVITILLEPNGDFVGKASLFG